MRKSLIAALLVSVSATAYAGNEDLQDGQLRGNLPDSLQAWDAEQEMWLSPQQFWRNYADRKGGLTWGERNDYPPYAQVQEFDTLLIKLESGSCLMEFFHSRWRRANDVRRWDDRFNRYSGCARVFD